MPVLEKELEAKVNKLESKVKPLVSVGITSFNRPDTLRRTLESLLNQTYENLEIIVSDNNSEDPRVDEVVQEFLKSDNRIQYIKQKTNIGSLKNGKFVMNQARGEYFLQACDDDFWEPDYIELCMAEFEKGDYVAVTTEAQYFYGDKKFEFFKEGEAFYNFSSDNTFKRMNFALDNAYGNLVYGVYKRDILFEDGKNFIEIYGTEYINELPYFLYHAQKGNRKVIEKIGFYKQASKATYEHVKWSIYGGKYQIKDYKKHLKSMKGVFVYLVKTHKDTARVIGKLKINTWDKYFLNFKLAFGFTKHFMELLFGYKRKKNA